MRFELPACRRCCACVPLRYGIIIIGYLNLAFSLFVLGLGLFLDIGLAARTYTVFVYRGVGLYTELWLPYILYLFEMIFNVILIVGAHTKRPQLLRVYYYYGIVTALAALLCLSVSEAGPYRSWRIDPLMFCLAFSGFVLQCYLLLLIRSELGKARYEAGRLRYVNHLAEAALDLPEAEVALDLPEAEPLPLREGRNPF